MEIKEYTPEEKAQYWAKKNAEKAKVYEHKDRMIVRQNALGHATQICIHNSNVNDIVTYEDVIKLAEKFENWVMR